MDQVIYYFTHLFDPANFPPRWLCGFWTPFTGWFYILSDLAIWGAYMSIPLILLYFIVKRKDMPFLRIFWLFAAFIFACGSTHLMDAIMFWWPAYRLTGLIYFITGVVSWATVLALIPIIPQALSLKSPRELEIIIQARTEELQKRTSDLLDSESRLRAILETTEDAIITMDENARIQSFNHAATHLFGYTPEEALGSSVRLLMPAPYRDQSDTDIARTLKAQLPALTGTGKEATAQRKDGTAFPIELSVSEVQLEGQRIVTGIIRDITERQKVQEELYSLTRDLEERVAKRTEQLEAVNRELEAFSYSVSHDLRAPLRGIDGFSQALLEDYHDQLDEQGKHFLNRVRQGSQQMGKLIDDMLELSRLTRGHLSLSPVNLSTVAEEIMRDFREQEPNRVVEFILPETIIVKGDRRLLHVVMQNLLDNAWKYTSKNPSARIEFGMTPHQDAPTYFVKDDGAGFDMQYANKLFSAFQRLHGANEFPGSGVGLATVSRIIHRHGGQVWAESELEKGSTFYFTIGTPVTID